MGIEQEKDSLGDLLDKEIENWEEELKNLQNQIPNEEDEEVEDEEVEEEDADDTPEDKEVSLEDLQKQLDQLDKERRGLYKDLKTERRTRQEMGEQLNSLNQVIQNIIQQRQAALPTDDKSKPAGISFEFNEDGEAFIPKDKLDTIVSPLKQEIEELKKVVKITTSRQEMQNAANAAIQKVISEDERFAKVWPTYRQAREWANEKVVEFQEENSLQGVMTSGQAMSYVFDSELVKEFNTKFPGIDLERVVIAEDSDYFLKKTLAHIADATIKKESDEVVEKKKKDGDRFRKVLQKPNGLGSSANKGSVVKSVVETAESLSSLDALELTDAQVRALERALLKEEQVNGISFK